MQTGDENPSQGGDSKPLKATTSTRPPSSPAPTPGSVPISSPKPQGALLKKRPTTTAPIPNKTRSDTSSSSQSATRNSPPPLPPKVVPQTNAAVESAPEPAKTTPAPLDAPVALKRSFTSPQPNKPLPMEPEEDSPRTQAAEAISGAPRGTSPRNTFSNFTKSGRSPTSTSAAEPSKRSTSLTDSGKTGFLSKRGLSPRAPSLTASSETPQASLQLRNSVQPTSTAPSSDKASVQAQEEASIVTDPFIHIKTRERQLVEFFETLGSQPSPYHKAIAEINELLSEKHFKNLHTAPLDELRAILPQPYYKRPIAPDSRGGQRPWLQAGREPAAGDCATAFTQWYRVHSKQR